MPLDLSCIGASDMPALLGISRYGSPTTLWARLVYGARPEEPSQAARLGTLFERGIAVALLEQLGDDEPEALHKPESRVLPGRLRYSLDFTTTKPRVIECKMRTRRSMAVEKWGAPPGGCAFSVAMQVQFQAACMRRDRDFWVGTPYPEIEVIDVGVLADGSEILHYPVVINEHVGSSLIEKAEEFFRKHVDTKIPPDLDGSDATAQWLRDEYATVKRDPREATADELRMVNEYRDITEQIKAREELQKTLKNRLSFAIGEYKGIFDPRDPTKRIMWAEVDGRVNWKEVATELAKGMTDEQKLAIQQKHKGERFRRWDARI